MKISTVIPVYNDYKHLEYCLRSIQAARPQPYEVIVVDDGSVYDMRFLIKEFSFVQVIRQEPRMGPGYARYIGLKACKGDVVAFLDSDCYIKPDWFEVIGAYLHEDIGGIGGNYLLANTDRFVAYYEAVDIFSSYAPNAKLHNNLVPLVIGGCCVFWKFVLLNTNFKPTFVFGRIAAGEDTLLGLEVKKKYKFITTKAVSVYHHFHETWRQYFRKRFIDGWSHTVIFLLYGRALKSHSYVRYAYIVMQLFATALFAYLLIRGNYLILWFVFLGLLYVEIDFFRFVFSAKLVRWKKKLALVSIHPLCILVRNVCWLAGVIAGVTYFLFNYGRLIRLTIPAESNITA